MMLQLPSTSRQLADISRFTKVLTKLFYMFIVV